MKTLALAFGILVCFKGCAEYMKWMTTYGGDPYAMDIQVENDTRLCASDAEALSEFLASAQLDFAIELWPDYSSHKPYLGIDFFSMAESIFKLVSIRQ